MACFANINVLQGSVATYTRCDVIFNIHLTTFARESSSEIFLNRFRFDRIVAMRLQPRSFAHSA